MAPDVLPFDLVVHDPRAFRHDGPRRGDAVVVVGADGSAAVRRVIALPGETVELRRGIARVEGVERVEDYRLLGRRNELFVPAATLGAGEWLVLSDQRSREEAASCRVPRAAIRGRASYVLLPGDFDPLRMGAPVR
jgi:signal peptidase I